MSDAPASRPDRATQEAVNDILREIEKETGAQILMAFDYGSRSRGLDNPVSDHDIHFVYRDPPVKAFSIFGSSDSIDRKLPIPVDGSLADCDLTGWSLRRTLQLCCNASPITFGLVSSPLRYRDDPELSRETGELLASLPPFAKSRSCHNIARKNLGLLSRGGYRGGIKNCLYMVQYLLSSAWIIDHGGELPPHDFRALVEKSDFRRFPGTRPVVREDILEMADMKQAPAGQRIPLDPVIHWGLVVSRQLGEEISEMPKGSPDHAFADRIFLSRYRETFASEPHLAAAGP